METGDKEVGFLRRTGFRSYLRGMETFDFDDIPYIEDGFRSYLRGMETNHKI